MLFSPVQQQHNRDQKFFVVIPVFLSLLLWKSSAYDLLMFFYIAGLGFSHLSMLPLTLELGDLLLYQCLLQSLSLIMLQRNVLESLSCC